MLDDRSIDPNYEQQILEDYRNDTWIEHKRVETPDEDTVFTATTSSGMLLRAGEYFPETREQSGNEERIEEPDTWWEKRYEQRASGDVEE
jgi:hypothetical protein